MRRGSIPPRSLSRQSVRSVIMDASFSKLTVKDQVVCKYCGKVRAYAGMARHQRSKKCLEAKAKQVVERAKQELSNLEAEYQKELAQLKAKYRNRAKELQQIITTPPLPPKTVVKVSSD